VLKAAPRTATATPTAARFFANSRAIVRWNESSRCRVNGLRARIHIDGGVPFTSAAGDLDTAGNFSIRGALSAMPPIRATHPCC